MSRNKLIGIMIVENSGGFNCEYAFNQTDKDGITIKTNCRGNLYLLDDKEEAAKVIFKHIINVMNVENKNQLIGIMIMEDSGGFNCEYAFNKKDKDGIITKTNCRGNLYLLNDKEEAAKVIFKHVINVMDKNN